MITMERAGMRARPTVMKRLRTMIAVAGLLTVVACGNNGDDAGDAGTTAVPENGSGSGTETEQTPLTGVQWQLDGLSVDGASPEPPAKSDVFLEFTDGSVGGNTGCNTFGGNAEVSEDGSTVTFSDVIATKRACSGVRGEIDTAVLTMLNGEVAVETSGDTLTLTNAAGDKLELRAGDAESDG